MYLRPLICVDRCYARSFHLLRFSTGSTESTSTLTLQFSGHSSIPTEAPHQEASRTSALVRPGFVGQSKSAERSEEGQNLTLRALFNQKEVTVFDLAKRILNSALVQFPLLSSCKETFVDKTPLYCWLSFTNPFNSSPSRFHRND